MKAGDLVKLTDIIVDGGLFGIILNIERTKNDRYEDTYLVLWTDGDITWEFRVDLEVTCKLAI